jgi:type II secretory pathway component PulK
MTPMVLILIVVFVVAPIAAAMAKRLESGANQPPAVSGGADPERVARQIEALVEQVQELAEHQEFLTRLLEDTTESGRPALTEDGDR